MAPDNVGDGRPGAARRLRGGRPAARTWRTVPTADYVLRPGHLRGPAVHRGGLQRSGWGGAPLIAPGLVAGSGAHANHQPHPETGAVTQGRGRVHPETGAGAQASPEASAVTLAVACVVAAFRVGPWSRLPGRPLCRVQQLARCWPLAAGFGVSPDSLSGFRMVPGR